MKGRYIAIEGPEGAGKSHVTQAVAALLRDEGRDVEIIREPGGTPTGERIRRVLLEGDEVSPWAEALLFAAARAQLALDVIDPARSRGAVVIGDRSVYSSLAYQGGARGLGLAEVRAVNEAGLGGVWPDLVVLLRVSARHGLARQDDADRIGGETGAFHERVVAAYDELAADEPDRFEVIDATGDLDGVIAAAAKAIRGAL